MDRTAYLKEMFASSTGDSAYEIEGFDKDNMSWVIRYNNSFGVAFVFDRDIDIYETFSNAVLMTKKLNFEAGGTNKVLMLLSSEEGSRAEFAVICNSFIELGTNNEQRREILADPLKWWGDWASLIGNKNQDIMGYDVFGELLTVLELYKKGLSPCWASMKLGTHDIEVENAAYEVKTSQVKSETKITINSQFQLQGYDEIYLVFNRVEESNMGQSIDDVLKQLEEYDVDLDVIEKYLSQFQLQKGNHNRKQKFKLLERRLYKIDENFPLITPESFISGQLPSHVCKITYTVDLAGLEYELWQ